MIPQFKTLPQLFDYFKDEKTCREHLEQSVWFLNEGKPICPHCGSKRVYNTSTTTRYKCANNKCYKKFNVTVGTIFENTKVSLRLWFAAIYLCTQHKKGISSHQLGRDLGVTQRTAWFMLHRIRNGMKERAPSLLNGVVEADETLVGGKNKNRHYHKKKVSAQGGWDKTYVLGIVERGGEIKTYVLPNTDKDTMQHLVLSNINPDALLITDSHSSYKTVHERHAAHVIVKKDGSYVTDKFFHTNNIENFWSLLKRGLIGIYHYVSPAHLHRYCDEFTYRFNMRNDEAEQRFDVLLMNSKGARLTYKKLISSRDPRQ